MPFGKPPPVISDAAVTIPRAQYKAYRAAKEVLQAVVSDVTDAYSASFIKPDILIRALEALAALRAADIDLEDKT
jgi:hypothetical protein